MPHTIFKPLAIRHLIAVDRVLSSYHMLRGLQQKQASKEIKEHNDCVCDDDQKWNLLYATHIPTLCLTDF